ncbi:MAG: hypothetical protein ACJZ40_01525 [Candidatus Poseidoniaceae archaeon]
MDWDYHNEGSGTWVVERSRENDDEYGDMGEMSSRRYQWLTRPIERIRNEIEQEKRRAEEEKRRREEEEQRKMESARSTITDAVRNGAKALGDNQFERAEQLLENHSVIYNRYRGQLDFSEYDRLINQIQRQKVDWVNQNIESISNFISQKKWDEAKKLLDGLNSQRVSSAGLQSQVDTLRATLNRERKEWEAAEKERLRLEKIANEKRSKEMVEQRVKTWAPKVTEADLLSDIKGYEAFTQELKSTNDWNFLEEHNEWSKEPFVSAVEANANELLHQAKLAHLSTLVSELIANKINRENVLSDEILSGDMNPMNEGEMQILLSKGIDEHFTHVGEYISKNNFQLAKGMIENFTIMMVEARSAYIEEVKRAKNTELAKAMVGNLLGMQSEEDFVSMVGQSYIGEHKVRFFVDENGVRKELTDGPKVIEHIQSGNDLIIVLEDCYETEQEKAHGHIKNRKIFEN